MNDQLFTGDATLEIERKTVYKLNKQDLLTVDDSNGRVTINVYKVDDNGTLAQLAKAIIRRLQECGYLLVPETKDSALKLCVALDEIYSPF